MAHYAKDKAHYSIFLYLSETLRHFIQIARKTPSFRAEMSAYSKKRKAILATDG